MSVILDNFVENTEVKAILSENEEIINEADQMVNDFKDVIKNFVLSNPDEFIGESIDITVKNIRVFSEVATAQYITEITNQVGDKFTYPQPAASVNDYL